MYYDFCHLKHDPFAELSDPECLFLSTSHKAALQALMSGIEAGQELLALFGAPGLGKTTILRTCQARIESPFQMIFLDYPKLSFRDVLVLIYQECGLACTTDSPAAMLSQLYKTLQEDHKHGWHVVLLIDEAHHLPVQTLESFFHLFVLQTATGENLFQLVLAGLPTLQHTLNLRQLRPLRKRLAVRATLAPLTPEESRAYIYYRLAKVFLPEDELFTPGALKHIVRYARGNPRVLNTLCSNMLITGSLRQQKPISVQLAREVIADVGTKSPRLYLRRGAVAAAGLLLAAGLWWGWQTPWLSSAKRSPLELSSRLAQRTADIFRSPIAEQPEEVPVLSPPGATVASPPQAMPTQMLLPEPSPVPDPPSLQAIEPIVPQVSVPTETQERRPPRGSEREMERLTPQMPATPPKARRVTPTPGIYEEQEKVPVDIAAMPTPNNPGASSPQDAHRPEPALPPLSSAPSIKGLKTLDQALLSESGGTGSATMPKVQTVHFYSLPDAATVSINGRVVGTTPVTVQLPMGSHTIFVEKSAYASKSYRLNIDRDGESNLYHNLDEGGGGR
jgi:general secretion pathway protein A